MREGEMREVGKREERKRRRLARKRKGEKEEFRGRKFFYQISAGEYPLVLVLNNGTKKLPR
jgi:hypothetical protein